MMKPLSMRDIKKSIASATRQRKSLTDHANTLIPASATSRSAMLRCTKDQVKKPPNPKIVIASAIIEMMLFASNAVISNIELTPSGP